jgi:hypothetical protein
MYLPHRGGPFMQFVRHRLTLAAATPEPLIFNFQTALDARAALMVRRHGLVPDRQPVFIVMALDPDKQVRDAVLDTIAYVTWVHDFWGDSASAIHANETFCFLAGAIRRPKAIDLISFWPAAEK